MALGKNSVLGIDIGTTSIKVVELIKHGSDVMLNNYVEYHRTRNKKTFPFQTDSFSFFEEDVASKLIESLEEASIETRVGNFSLPSFSGFFTTFELPRMERDEIEEAVKYQSYKYIPLPLQEVILDWEILEEEPENKNFVRVLLVAIPRDIIEKHKKVAEFSDINIKTLEIESFSDIRSLVGEDKSPTVIVNIGDRATNIIVVDQGYLRVSHSLDFAGFHITKGLSEGLNVSFTRAEELKKEKGVVKELGGLVSTPVFSIIDKIIFGMQKAINAYLSKNPRRQIEKIILSGGTANMPGICDYFYSKSSIKTEVGQPFKDVVYNESLKKTIENIGPSFSVAVGVALREFRER